MQRILQMVWSLGLSVPFHKSLLFVLAIVVWIVGGPASLERSNIAHAQDLGGLLRDTSRILNELGRQQRIEEQRRQHEEVHRQDQRPRSDRTRVAQIQSRLTQLGYDPGPVDGVMGQRTRRAILAFQRDYGLTQSGSADAATAAALQRALGSHGIPQTPTGGRPAGK
ncbi:peptidoglycan-binding protein [Jhaorihella thermophila]